MRLERFPTSLDGLQRAVTGLVLAVCATVLAVQFTLCAPPFQWIPWFTSAALAVTLGSCWALAPAGIEVDEGRLLIRRRAWQPVTIALPDITSIECNQEDVLSGAVRLWGVGGFFGSFGIFWSRKLGRFRGYLTRKGALVSLHLRQGVPILVTPDEPLALAACLRHAGVPERSSTREGRL